MLQHPLDYPSYIFVAIKIEIAFNGDDFSNKKMYSTFNACSKLMLNLLEDKIEKKNLPFCQSTII
jgi:hypothetical protein